MNRARIVLILTILTIFFAFRRFLPFSIIHRSLNLLLDLFKIYTLSISVRTIKSKNLIRGNTQHFYFNNGVFYEQNDIVSHKKITISVTFTFYFDSHCDVKDLMLSDLVITLETIPVYSLS